MKKLLSIIAAGTLVITAGSTLVSCGMSATKLMARKVNTKEYKGFMTAALNTWSPGSSNQNSDAIIGENLYDGLLTPNAHNEIEGQMANWWGHNQEGTEYYFHLRDKETSSEDGRKTGIPKWTITKDGKVTGTENVSPMDFYNAFRFTFNPNASADGAAPTNGLFKNGSALVDGILPTITEYDTLLNKGKNFGRTTEKGGTSNIAQEAISTRNFDIIIMLVNLWSATEEGQAKINKLAAAKIDAITEEKDGKEVITGYNRIQEFDNLITEIKYYTTEANFQQLITDSAQNGGMMAVSLATEGLGTATSEKADSGQMYNIRYTLQNPSTSFFTSAAGYGSLKPLPFYAVSYSDTQNRSWYNFSKRYQPSINEMWFSGAYYVQSYKAGTNAVLLKNPHYYQADRTYIEKATYTLTRTASVDSNRLWFEGGDASEVAISPNDASGWKKYVGDDYNADEQKFAFEGTHATSTVPSQYSFTTFYNYGRVSQKDGKKIISASSKAMAQKSVRLYLNYIMQRTQFPAYIAGKLDNNENTKESLAWDKDKNVKTRSSTLLRNVFTIPKLAVNTDKQEDAVASSAPDEIRGVSVKDYTIQNVGSDYNKMYGTKNMELEPTETAPTADTDSKTRLAILEENITTPNFDKEKLEKFYNEQFGSLVDGNDAFYQNDLMALGMFLKDDGTDVIPELEDELKKFADSAYKSVIDREQNDKSVDQANEKAKAKILGDVVRQDLESKKILEKGKNQSISLEWLLNGLSRLTLNPRVEYIVEQFNSTVGDNSPIKLVATVSNDNADYVNKSKIGEYDILVSGWGPDYTDPYNFLHTMIFGGEYNSYTKLKTVVKSNGTSEGSENVPKLIMNDGYEEYDSVYQDLRNTVANYTGIVETAKGESDFTQRLIQLSKAETYALYNVGFTATLYNKTPMKTIQLSYLDPFTRSSFIAGSSNLRLFGVKMIESLWNKEEFLKAQAQFNEGSDNSVAEYKKLYVYDPKSDGIVTASNSGIPSK
ncbi:oligopeptide ABC transporter substrate-binding protein OppA [Mesoplasma melaleucae]|uniref:Oligopeptide ABC transporter substrate-binding protein n=1 Tax=Mesoplasma melaleucae TaxID=81459 RepID=A0A2K8NVA4_9MOLU|nr:oligopeptide ABC transporter substrate-binding protein OppA [Mesoplasma melaleucae]ATZ17707.1 oligopeptide ABC transporter substrate-binding protein [Mesoplasma melaleucae]